MARDHTRILGSALEGEAVAKKCSDYQRYAQYVDWHIMDGAFSHW